MVFRDIKEENENMSTQWHNQFHGWIPTCYMLELLSWCDCSMNETWEVEGKIINAVAYMLLIALERMKTISETAENWKPKKNKKS